MIRMSAHRIVKLRFFPILFLSSWITAAICQTPALQITASSTLASCNNTNGSITINASGGTPPLMYSIDKGATYQSSNVFNGLDSGLYFVQAKDANNAIVSLSVQVTALPTPKVRLGDDTVLCTGSILFLSVPQQAGLSYVWDDNSTGYSYTVTQSGAYSVKVTNQYGCYASTSINVIMKATTLFTLGNDTTVCYGQDVQLKPTPTLSGIYSWSNGSNAPALNVSTPGIYWLKVTDSGCIKRDSIKVSYKLNPQVSLGDDTALCAGQTLLLDVTNNGSLYSWQDGSANPTFKVSSAGTYSVKVAQGGCDTTVRVTVSYITGPPINFPKDTTICATQQLILDAEYPFSTYQWQDGSVLSRYTVTKAGLYSVTATDHCGTTQDSINVHFENCICHFSVPNAFTPNGDGRNDVFLPKNQCPVSNYELKMYNRLGQLVFTSRNVSIGWDGSFGEKQQPEGVYVWALDYTDGLTGKRTHNSGTVVLIH